MKSLPNTSTHDQQWALNPRAFNLGPNALLTWLHAEIDDNIHFSSQNNNLLQVER